MRVIDWIARTTMLILAALATLALIGSLASVSDTPMSDAVPGRIAQQAIPGDDVGVPPAFATPSDASPGASAPAATAGPAATVEGAIEPATAVRDRDVARWLKALTYALLALTAVAAAGVVALLRVGGHLARIAER